MNGRILMKYKDLEGSDHGLTEVLYWYLRGQTKENYKKKTPQAG